VSSLDTLTMKLSKDEIMISNKFVKDIDTKNYIISHAYLRKILSSYYSHIKANQWQFDKNSYGRPEISKVHNIKFYFNLSHTTTCAYIICSNIEKCGIDVEDIKNIEITKGMRDLVFTKEELLKYDNSDSKRTIFYETWTKKEAYLKALGIGFMRIMPNEINFKKEKNNYFWSSNFNERRFLSFCLLDSQIYIEPNYIDLKEIDD